jgi:glutamate---cysteine ligase / carboxylate-amine ligase
MQESLAKKHLFEAYGIELEYMIVDSATLNVKPITDQLFFACAKTYDSEIEKDPISWNNELALHILELKTTVPTANLDQIHRAFTKEVRLINRLLKPFNACLMPTAMHPWMNPIEELRLWPHGDNPWYAEFDRIFDCRGHGWANLQSMHINFPFAGEDEFLRLHAAIRLILPIIPAIAASSPLMEKKLTGFKDNRLEVYKTNSKIIPSVTGEVIPEVVHSFADYHKILTRISDDLSAKDIKKVLDPEWTNSRGAIVRFERSAIEIRLIDTQESAYSDLAVSHAITSLVRWLTENYKPEYNDFDEKRLKTILDQTIRHAENAVIEDSEYLKIFESSGAPSEAGALWNFLFDRHLSTNKTFEPALQAILANGPLSTRIINALEKHSIEDIYRLLCRTLHDGKIFYG